MIEVYTLFSGSGGNCIFIRDKMTAILVDAGKSATAIEKSLNGIGASLRDIKAIFLTHEHADHTLGLEMISKKYHIPVHMTAPSYKKAVKNCTSLFSCAICHEETEYVEKTGSLTVSSFEVPHDSEQNVGFVIENDDGEKFGTATDIGHVTDKMKEKMSLCTEVIIEANHDLTMLENGPYPPFLKDRIASDTGHLSNRDCADFALYLANQGVTSFTLAHISKENNTPDIAFFTVRNTLDKNGFTSVPIHIALPSYTVNVKGKTDT